MRSLLFILTALALFAVAGCDSGDVPAAVAMAPSADVAPPPPAGSGVISGQVKLITHSGKLPEPIMLRGMGGREVPDERVLVGESGELQNVVLRLEGISDSTGPQRSPVVLDQVDFRYTPHVVGVQVGQTLRVKSSDNALHNIHIHARQNQETNQFTRTAGEWLDYVYEKPEVLRIKCDVHPWMLAHVVVTENPYFAVSDADGRFEITGIPDGEYTLVAWHELYGTQQHPVTVEDGQPVQQAISFEAP